MKKPNITVKRVLSLVICRFKRGFALHFTVCALLTVLVSEILSSGFASGLTYFFRRPVSFLCAALIVYLTYCICLFFRRRTGVFLFIEGVWLGLAVANCVLLSYRVNPLSAVDFSIIFSVFSIINVYLSVFQMVLIIAAIVLAVAAAVFCMLRLPKKEVNVKSAGRTAVFTAAVTVVAFFASTLLHAPLMEGKNLPDVYDDFGFVYSLTLTCFDRGIDRPDEYSRVNISELLPKDETDGGESEKDTAQDGDGGERRPNVVFVQLESFFDPELIKGLALSEDAIPNFRKLYDTFPSGELTVPVSGAGTVNTEFEVLCGIPISVFGLGEYPYETVLRDTPCESLAYYFRTSGYTAHALHNHTGTFYDRYVVMQNLGFDTFTPVECMVDVEHNILGWAHDEVLTREILGAMESTEGEDFVYAISVQAHGKYTTEPTSYGSVTVSGDFSEEQLCAMKYYVNQIKDTDAFVGELIDEVEALEEDTVIVFFGDHQPSLDLRGGVLESSSLYTTQYAIWTNFSLEAEKSKNLTSYELGMYVLKLLGERGGVISSLHGTAKDGGDYTSNIKDVAYDLLFGEKYAYGGSFPYEVRDIDFGWREMNISLAYVKDDALFVTGEGFTESSVLFADGKKRDTVYVSPTLLIAPGVTACEEVTVSLLAENGVSFGTATCKTSEEAELDFEVTWKGKAD